MALVITVSRFAYKHLVCSDTLLECVAGIRTEVFMCIVRSWRRITWNVVTTRLHPPMRRIISCRTACKGMGPRLGQKLTCQTLTRRRCISTLETSTEYLAAQNHKKFIARVSSSSSSPVPSPSPSLLYLLAQFLCHSLTDSPTSCLTGLLVYLLTHLLTCSLTYLLTYLLTHLLTCLHTYLLSHLLTYLLTR